MIMQKNAGFTLTELIIVFAVLVVLAIIAVPRYFDVKTEAQKAETTALAEALAAANTANYKSRLANSTKGISVTNCVDIARAIPNGLPVGYTISSLKVAIGATVNCTLTGLGSTTAHFSVTGIK